jgi:hypothetical protein
MNSISNLTTLLGYTLAALLIVLAGILIFAIAAEVYSIIRKDKK